MSICKAGAGGSLAQDSRDVGGELVFSNRGISRKGKCDTEWDRERGKQDSILEGGGDGIEA